MVIYVAAGGHLEFWVRVVVGSITKSNIYFPCRWLGGGVLIVSKPRGPYNTQTYSVSETGHRIVNHQVLDRTVFLESINCVYGYE